MGNSRKYWALGFFAYVALTLWCVFAYVGPGRWLAELQLSLLGSYAGIWSVVVLMIPAIVLLRVAGRGARIDPGQEIESSLGSEWLQDLFVPSIIIVAGLAVSGVLWGHSFGEDLGAIGVDRAVAADEPGFYATVSGKLSNDALVVRKGSTIPMLYVPMDSPGKSSGAIRMVVEIQENYTDERIQAASDGTSSTFGYVDSRLGGDVRSWLAKQTHRPVADRARVLHAGVRSPSKARMALAALLLLTFGIAGMRLRSNRIARRRTLG